MNSTYFDIFIIISYHSLNGQIVCSSQVDLGMQITFSINNQWNIMTDKHCVQQNLNYIIQIFFKNTQYMSETIPILIFPQNT